MRIPRHLLGLVRSLSSFDMRRACQKSWTERLESRIIRRVRFRDFGLDGFRVLGGFHLWSLP